MRASHTAIVERNVWWAGAFTTEPYEAAWAGEAIFFVRTLESHDLPPESAARVQISPDGITWCDEGTSVEIRPEGLSFCRAGRFGGWLRLAGELPAGSQARVIVSLVLKA